MWNTLFSISLIKTLYFNFKYFKPSVAVRLPVVVSRHVYLRKVSGKVIIDAGIVTGMIRFGFGKVGIFDDKYSRSIWEVSGVVCFKGTSRLGHGTKISVGEKGLLIIGARFCITAESSIVAHKSITIADDCLFSWDVLVMDCDFHSYCDGAMNVINSPQPIVINNNVWICCRSLVLKGAIVPEGSIIGAGSMVNSALGQPHALYVGSPCKLARSGIFWRE